MNLPPEPCPCGRKGCTASSDPTQEPSFWEGAELISVYTRAQAIADGTLVDLTEWASNGPNGMLGGFTVPVAVTAAVWADVATIPEWAEGQDVRGRAHDLLWLALCAARRHRDTDRFLFRVILTDRRRADTYRLQIGPGDHGEPVITIMKPDED